VTPALRRVATASLVAAVLSSASAAAGMAPLDALVAAYPDHLSGHDGVALIWRDGTRMPVSDGVAEKSFDALLNNADINDMFAIPYVPGPPVGEPPLNGDPGRIRNTAFFAKLYGDCHTGAVKDRLKKVRWVDGSSVPVSAVNGLADRLQRVADELAKLPQSFRKFLAPSGGTYNCRNIAGTELMSMHAFGAAIDISTATTDYWRWNRPVGGLYPYRNQVPFEIVAIFERYGFIWGGKWYHYDTMHFEYRPELLLHAGEKPVGF
jgi:hypothetical protein